MARLFRIAAADPVLIARRVVYGKQGKPVEWTLGTYRADRYRATLSHRARRRRRHRRRRRDADAPMIADQPPLEFETVAKLDAHLRDGPAAHRAASSRGSTCGCTRRR